MFAQSSPNPSESPRFHLSRTVTIYTVYHALGICQHIS
nr:MAG TPA: hypothetical protein [Caudoviricetes sp.]